MTVVPIASITIGERDREDIGQIEDLATSIAKVGLLHPVAVTADMALVCGGRRLAAVRVLGWTEVPVTVVTLDNLADVLQAEADENTCRKGLTPVEAARARERRARLLAPVAKANAGRRTDLEPDSKLAGGSIGEIRKAAAAGTGYSASTLDKVDKIRAVAERGVIPQGKGEVPAPPAVIEVARKALADVSTTGAAVDRSAKDVDAAIEAYVTADPDVRKARYVRSVYREIAAASGLPRLDAEYAAEALDAAGWADLMGLRESLDNWFRKAAASRPATLRVIGGK